MNNENKREDKRIAPRYRCRCYVKVLSTEQTWEAHLLNFSESGILIAVLDEHSLSQGASLEVLIEIEEGEVIDLVGEVAHRKNHYVGIKCQALTETDYARYVEALTGVELKQDPI